MNYNCVRCGYYVNPSGSRTRDVNGRMYHVPGQCITPEPTPEFETPREPVHISLGVRAFCRGGQKLPSRMG